MSPLIDDSTLADLGWPQITDALADRCGTAMAAERALSLAPLATPEDARERIAEVAEARALAAADAALAFAGITDIGVAVGRAEKGGVLAPEELVAVGDAGRGFAALRERLDRHAGAAPRLSAIAGDIDDLGHVFHPILEAFEPGPRLADHASDALGPLRRKVAALASELESRAQGLLDDPRLARHLQDRFTTQREDRYVVPIKVESQAWVKGIVHGTSQSGHTVFVEPEAIVDLNNRLKLAEYEVADEERRILTRLTGYVAEDAGALRRALAAAVHLDVVAASARLADDLDASPPAIEEGAGLSLRRARHPLMVLGGRPCVPNDLELRPRTVLVISGPNAGGKTVALKTAGLVVAMAHAGLHVPADEPSSLPWVSAVHTHIGDAQNLDKDLSTFSAQVVDIDRYLREADERSLILFDEVAVGTDPEQGAALAQAVLEALADRGVSAIVTTHYDRLKAMPPEDARFANASVGFDLDQMQPTFHLHLGLPGSSGALDVARRLGLPDRVVARAEELVGSGRAGVDKLLADIAAEREAIAAERRGIEDARAGLERARERADEERAKLRDKRRRLEESEHGEAIAALRRARAEIERVHKQVRRAGRRADATAARERLDRAAREVSAHAPQSDEPSGIAPRPEELAPGVDVALARLGGRGKVLAAPERGRVAVQVGSLRTQVPIEDVRLEPKARPPRRERERERAPTPQAEDPPIELVSGQIGGRAPLRTPDITVDVRGQRVHEAIAQLDRFLDQSLLAPREIVFVIHGHGTGALRTAVRDHLAGHGAVQTWRPGEPGEGGDGVTVAWLDAS